MNESDPLIEPVSVNSQTYDGAAPKLQPRSVKAPLGPFVCMLIALLIILLTLGALAVKVGGCATDAPACFAASMAESQMINGTGKWVSMAGSGVEVRVLAAAPPVFLLNLLTKYQLLGAWRLFALPVADKAATTTVLGKNDTDKRAPFDVIKPVAWLSSGQIQGQFSRTGMECTCARANRTTLGTSLTHLTPKTVNGTAVVDVRVYQGNTTTPASLIDHVPLRKTFNLTEAQTLSAQANAVFSNGDKVYLFIDFLTKTKDDPYPIFFKHGIAVGSLADNKPYAVPEPNTTFSLSPTAAMTTATDAAKAIYLFFNDKADQPMLAQLPGGEKSLVTKDIDIKYFGGIVNKQPTWVALDKAKPLDYGCSVHSVHAGQALCLTPIVKDKHNVTSNELHVVPLATPWSALGKAAQVLVSLPNEPFSSVEWHPETATTKAISFSTIAIKKGHRSGLPAFWQFEKKQK